MEVHIALPNGHAGVTVDELLEITLAAEELGFDGVWPLDHVLVGPDLKERYPWVVEPMTLLGYLAARTRNPARDLDHRARDAQPIRRRQASRHARSALLRALHARAW